jgi:hypothetical protein
MQPRLSHYGTTVGAKVAKYVNSAGAAVAALPHPGRTSDGAGPLLDIVRRGIADAR